MTVAAPEKLTPQEVEDLAYEAITVGRDTTDPEGMFEFKLELSDMIERINNGYRPEIAQMWENFRDLELCELKSRDGYHPHEYNPADVITVGGVEHDCNFPEGQAAYEQTDHFKHAKATDALNALYKPCDALGWTDETNPLYNF